MKGDGVIAALCRGGLSFDLRQTGSLHCFFWGGGLFREKPSFLSLAGF